MAKKENLASFGTGFPISTDFVFFTKYIIFEDCNTFEVELIGVPVQDRCHLFHHCRNPYGHRSRSPTREEGRPCLLWLLRRSPGYVQYSSSSCSSTRSLYTCFLPSRGPKGGPRRGENCPLSCFCNSPSSSSSSCTFTTEDNNRKGDSEAGGGDFVPTRGEAPEHAIVIRVLSLQFAHSI